MSFVIASSGMPATNGGMEQRLCSISFDFQLDSKFFVLVNVFSSQCVFFTFIMLVFFVCVCNELTFLYFE